MRSSSDNAIAMMKQMVAQMSAMQSAMQIAGCPQPPAARPSKEG